MVMDDTSGVRTEGPASFVALVWVSKRRHRGRAAAYQTRDPSRNVARVAELVSRILWISDFETGRIAIRLGIVDMIPDVAKLLAARYALVVCPAAA
jgi:hypothetical protein